MKKILLTVFMAVICITIVACGNDANEKKEEAKKLTYNECFSNMEKIISDGAYNMQVTQYAYGEEKQVGTFYVKCQEKDSYVGLKREETDENYAFLYYFNKDSYKSDVYHYSEESDISYDYSGDTYNMIYMDETPSMLEDNYMQYTATSNLHILMQNGLDNGNQNYASSAERAAYPTYEILKECVISLVKEEKPFVKSKVQSVDGCKISVGFIDFLKWCDENSTDYNISADMSYKIDSYANDTILTLEFKADAGKVSEFSMILTSDVQSTKQGFLWKFTELTDDPQEVCVKVATEFEPGNDKKAVERKMNELDKYYSQTYPDSIVLYSVGNASTLDVDSDLFYGYKKVGATDLLTMIITKDSFMMEYFIYNGYNYNKAVLSGDEIIVYADFYERACWNEGGLQKPDEDSTWKSWLLADLLYYDKNLKGNIVYLNDDEIPEIVLGYEGTVELNGYIGGESVLQSFSCGDDDLDEITLYVKEKQMQLCTYVHYKPDYFSLEWYAYRELLLTGTETYKELSDLKKNKVDYASTVEVEYQYSRSQNESKSEMITKEDYESYVNTIKKDYKEIIVNQYSINELIYLIYQMQ